MFLALQRAPGPVGDREALEARTLVGDRRDDRQRSFAVRPPEWIGTATEAQLAFPYYTLWGFPEKFHRKHAERSDADPRPRRLTGDRRRLARLVRSR